MKITTSAMALCLAAAAGAAYAEEGARQVPHLDHAFVIVMENHHYSQVYGNAAAPFITKYANSANLATNYFGVGHPSLTNYLEIVGGSNFGVVNDFSPDWHNVGCAPNITGINSAGVGMVSNEMSTANICPIAGHGFDAPTPAVDTTNEGSATSPIYNDPYNAAPTVGISIADQLEQQGRSWKSYQENLPPYGADKVNNSDGLLSDSVGASFTAGLPKLYAVKHNPFVYFASVQEHGLRNIVSFGQLYSDLHSGNVPTLAFISPNQCHDQHGRGSSEMGTGCSVDANDIAQGDAALQNLVTAIHASPVWRDGSASAIVVVWDENDYSSLPNQVVTIVDTNYGVKGVKSATKYNHFSLLKTLEAGFGLSYLNHAADKNVSLMSDLFAR